MDTRLTGPDHVATQSCPRLHSRCPSSFVTWARSFFHCALRLDRHANPLPQRLPQRLPQHLPQRLPQRSCSQTRNPCSFVGVCRCSYSCMPTPSSSVGVGCRIEPTQHLPSIAGFANRSWWWLGSKRSKRQKRVSEYMELDQLTHLEPTHLPSATAHPNQIPCSKSDTCFFEPVCT
jgi:hypothetical protein